MQWILLELSRFGKLAITSLLIIGGLIFGLVIGFSIDPESPQYVVFAGGGALGGLVVGLLVSMVVYHFEQSVNTLRIFIMDVLSRSRGPIGLDQIYHRVLDLQERAGVEGVIWDDVMAELIIVELRDLRGWVRTSTLGHELTNEGKKIQVANGKLTIRK